jgi:hypothetical protein
MKKRNTTTHDQWQAGRRTAATLTVECEQLWIFVHTVKPTFTPPSPPAASRQPSLSIK